VGSRIQCTGRRAWFAAGMRIAIAGGHGKVALLLAEQLAGAGHEPVAIIRDAGQSDDVRAAGATPLVLDLESADVDAVAEGLAGADAVVFAAGAGPGSGAARKLTVDRDAAVLLADAAERAGVGRYVMVSSMGADGFDPERATDDAVDDDDVFQTYLRAKSEADADLRSRSSLAWTVVRPGGLTDDAPTGRVAVGSEVARGSIPRADVAAVLAVALTEGSGIGAQFEVVSGDTAIPEALRSL
jgi:nucleoside-diphosphate-sugar epimerase